MRRELVRFARRPRVQRDRVSGDVRRASERKLHRDDDFPHEEDLDMTEQSRNCAREGE
jgi:hypothetical protein